MAVKETVKEQVESVKNAAKYQAVKLHVRRNKKFYMGVGTGMFITLVVRRPTVQVYTTVQLGRLP